MVNLLKLNLFGYTLSVAVYKKWATTIGINSRVGKDKHVLFIDVDNMKLEDVINKLKFLNFEYGLGDCYILATHEDFLHFHVICPYVYPTRMIIKMLTDFGNLEYIPYGLKNNGWVLRVLPKDDRKKGVPIFCYYLPFESKRPRSLAHLEFLKRYYNAIGEIKPTVKDINKNLIIERYSTPNSGWKK